MTLPLFVVSLSTALRRREDFSQSVPSLQWIDWRFFDAHTSLGSGLSYDESRSTRVSLRPLQAGELGCYSSHVAIWQHMVESGCEEALVLEDDVVADWKFLDHIAQRNLAGHGIHYLRLFCKIPFRWRNVKTPFLDTYHHLVRIVGPALGTQGYYLSLAGAQRLLPHAKNADRPIDAFLDSVHVHGLPNLAIYPFPLFERFQESSIGDARLTPATHRSLRGIMTRAQRKLRLWSALLGPEDPEVRKLKKTLPSKPTVS